AGRVAGPGWDPRQAAGPVGGPASDPRQAAGPVGGPGWDPRHAAGRVGGPASDPRQAPGRGGVPAWDPLRPSLPSRVTDLAAWSGSFLVPLWLSRGLDGEPRRMSVDCRARLTSAARWPRIPPARAVPLVLTAVQTSAIPPSADRGHGVLQPEDTCFRPNGCAVANERSMTLGSGTGIV